MTWAEPISFRAALDDGAPHVVEMMAARDVDLDVDRVRLLISLARQAHRRCLSAWLQAHEPEYMAPRATGPYARWINRRRGNTGRFRDGSDLPKAPLVAIYALCNEWWRRETGRPFWCDFRALYLGEDHEGREGLEFINGPALFFTLIAQSVDEFNYTAKRCKKVHVAYYKRLNTRIPD